MNKVLKWILIYVLISLFVNNLNNSLHVTLSAQILPI